MARGSSSKGTTGFGQGYVCNISWDNRWACWLQGVMWLGCWALLRQVAIRVGPAGITAIDYIAGTKAWQEGVGTSAA